MKYHVNLETGKAGLCAATEGPCPLGDNGQHFDSEHEAGEFIENMEASNHDLFYTVSDSPKLPLASGRLPQAYASVKTDEGKYLHIEARRAERIEQINNLQAPDAKVVRPPAFNRGDKLMKGGELTSGEQVKLSAFSAKLKDRLQASNRTQESRSPIPQVTDELQDAFREQWNSYLARAS